VKVFLSHPKRKIDCVFDCSISSRDESDSKSFLPFLLAIHIKVTNSWFPQQPTSPSPHLTNFRDLSLMLSALNPTVLLQSMEKLKSVAQQQQQEHQQEPPLLASAETKPVEHKSPTVVSEEKRELPPPSLSLTEETVRRIVNQVVEQKVAELENKLQQEMDKKFEMLLEQLKIKSQKD
jgi:hypothetical protein